MPYNVCPVYGAPEGGGSKVEVALHPKHMKRFLLAAAIFGPVLLSACANPFSANLPPAEYKPYEEGVVGEGRPVVLFFDEPSCTDCDRRDAMLKEWFGEETFRQSVYKVEANLAEGVRAQYGIAPQHTFVLLNSVGKAVTAIPRPNDAQIKILISYQLT
jgi:hypothetical protein